MANQINVGIQNQFREPFEATDSEAENQNADASLAGDSAGTNTNGNPDIVQSHIEGESVNPAPPETVATNNMLNRYGISDGIMIQRPEYTFNNRAAPDPAPVCPDQADLASSGLELTTPVSTKPMEKPSTGATSYAKDATNAPAPVTPHGTKLPAHDSVAFSAAREYGAQHGLSAEEVDQVAAIFAYYHCETPQHCKDTLDSLPFHITSIMQAIGWNSEGFYDVGFALRGMQEAQAIMNGDPNAANSNLHDLAGLGSPLLEGRSSVRAGTGQGGEDYAREMSMASYSGDMSYYDLGDDSYGESNSYDAPGNTSLPDLDPLPSLPPLDSNGPVMLPPPDVRLDHELAPIPNTGVADSFQQASGNAGLGNSSGNNFSGGVDTNGFNNASIGNTSQPSAGNTNAVNTNAEGGGTLPFNGDAPTEDITLTPEEEASLPRTSVEIGPLREVSNQSTPNSEGERTFMGLNGNGQPLYSDPASRQAAPSEIVPTNNRFHGYTNAVEGSIIGRDADGTPYSGVPDGSAPGGIRWYSLDFADTTAFRASQAADLLAAGQGGGGSTTESLPPIENLYKPIEGHAASNYRAAVAEMMNPNASWDERIINGTLATLSSPIAVLDMMGESAMNAANMAGRGGQMFARANVTNNTETRVTSILGGIVEMTNAFNGAVGPFAGVVGVPQRVMTVEELARRNLQSAEDLAAVRATYTLASNTPATTLANVENRIAAQSREIGVIIDRLTGQILGVSRAGLEDGARMNVSPAQRPQMSGNIYTHNHPLGGTFSVDDIATALGSNAAEIRAVTPTQTYSVTFNNPPAFLAGQPERSIVFLQEERVAIRASFHAGVADGTLNPPLHDATQMSLWYSNYFMEQLVERNPWIQYTVTPR